MQYWLQIHAQALKCVSTKQHYRYSVYLMIIIDFTTLRLSVVCNTHVVYTLHVEGAEHGMPAANSIFDSRLDPQALKRQAALAVHIGDISICDR